MYPCERYHSVYILFKARDTCAIIFARRDVSGQVGYISLDATFFIYYINGIVTFSAFDEGVPRCTVMVSGTTGYLTTGS